MHFNGLSPLAEGFPNIELRSGTFCFDIHNAADLLRITLDLESQRFEVEWRVENLLASTHYGPYHTARVVLTVHGVSEFSSSNRLSLNPEHAEGIDFIEYIPGAGEAGALRFMFTSVGEMSLLGTRCDLTYAVTSVRL
jgi:hypothetical protein